MYMGGVLLEESRMLIVQNKARGERGKEKQKSRRQHERAESDFRDWMGTGNQNQASRKGSERDTSPES